ncbi:hypothetical protein [Liquorilactobacillus oeni]|uniref:hypothetical protein n=1 Tax=Liquorilactobacillus oeni TaxID=303241 RepID=UPI001F258482|nr:hypothetical protein [Liquorilactobacillus oeni]
MGNWETSYNEVLAEKSFNPDDPSDVYFVMLVKYEYEHLNQAWNKIIADLPLNSKKWVCDRLFSLSHNLPEKNYGPDLLPAQPQDNFEQLVLDP